MRIISGKYKGKLMLEPPSEITRPMMHRVRDSMYNTLGYSIKNAKVCDLFGGSGSLGIEAVSRGAQSAVFVERDKGVVEIIKKNLANCKLEAKVFNMDYMQALEWFKAEGEQFDLFLLDPPFKSDYGINAIKFIVKNNLLKGEKQIVFETNIAGLESEFDKLNLEYKTKSYGSGKLVHFIKVK